MVGGVLRCVLLSLSSVLVAPIFNENLRLNADRWIARSRSHVGLGLSDEELRTVSNMEDFAQFDSALNAILVPRVPDTPSHAGVRQGIATSMRDLGWTVEEDRFTDDTPLRRDVAFTNVVATLDPLAPRRLVLACHYDSLRTTSGRFVGATDSAVPCAQLINLAHVLRGPLQQHRRAGEEVTLQFLFFDGEEAFVSWTRTDSTYGARYLANALQGTAYKDTGATGVSHLHRMDTLVLLDLLGAPNPRFYSYFPESEPLYLRLMSFERRLQAMNLTRGLPLMFQQQARYHAGIEDDHIPFLERGVPVLHLIPTPFPRVWHKDSDNKANLHGDTIRNQNALLRALVADYLSLQL